MWAASRWADTYLLSEEGGLAPTLEAGFGARGGGPAIAGFLVQASLAILVGWPGEMCGCVCFVCLIRDFARLEGVVAGSSEWDCFL